MARSFSSRNCYKKCLRLAQAVAKRGYKTAIDVPLSEDEFYYRKEIRAFDAWMQVNATSDQTHLDYLLTWFDKASHVEDLTYQQFLTVARLVASKGYKTTIDVPLSEVEFGDFFLKKYREFADALLNNYFVNNPQRMNFVKKFHQLAYTSDTAISPYKQSKILSGALRMEIESIKNEYRITSPDIKYGSFFSRGSQLYSLIKNLLNDTPSVMNEPVTKSALSRFSEFLKENDSTNVFDKMKEIEDGQSNESFYSMRMRMM